MKKLDDIPKKKIFEVPEDYFHQLPGVIQSRVEAQKQAKVVHFPGILRYAAAAIVIVAIGLWLGLRTSSHEAVEEQLAQIPTGELISYLEDSEMSVDELVGEITLDTAEVHEIENKIYDLTLGDQNAEEIDVDL
jgi:hypothetical protein